MKGTENVFDGSKEKQILIEALGRINDSINRLRNISQDSRTSLRVKISLEDLEWEKTKLKDKIDNLK